MSALELHESLEKIQKFVVGIVVTSVGIEQYW